MTLQIKNAVKEITSRRLTAFLLAAAIVLLSFLGLFAYFQSLMIQALSQLNGEFAQQVDTISSTAMDIIRNSAMQMYYSLSVKNLRTSSQLTNAQKTMGQRDLGNFVSSSSFINSVLIYNPRMDHVFTSDNDHPSAPSKSFFDQYAVWLLTNAPELDFAVSPKQTAKGGEYYSFIFCEPKAYNGGAMLLNVDADWYEQKLLGISSDEDCAILDKDGGVLAAGSDELAESAKSIYPQILEHINGHDDGFILDRTTSKGWMYCMLKTTEWYYLRAFNLNTVIPALTKMQRFTLVLLTAVCVILVAGGIYTLFNLYQPFHAVKKALIDAGEDTDEGVARQVDMLLENQLEHRLLKQYERVLSGSDDEHIRYPVTLIMTDYENSALLRELASASFEQLTVRADFGCCLLLFDANSERVPHFCTKVAQTLDCRCFYGHPCGSASELLECRQNLNELWQLRFLYCGQRVISESLLESHSFTGFQPKDISVLISALHTGQPEEAQRIWKEIFSDIRHCRFNDFRFAVRYIIKALNSAYKELSSEPLGLSSDILDGMEDIQQLHLALEAAFDKICSAENGRRMRRLDRIANEINIRISDGFADDGLSAQHIADEMGMNAVYLGRLFRESTGISISEAINRARVEHAKKLLLTTDDSVENIARRVGFNNVKYFFVVFKSVENTTPKKYRTEHEQKV